MTIYTIWDIIGTRRTPKDTKCPIKIIIAYRLTILRLHARFYLRVDPKGGALPHRAEQEGLEVEKDFVLALAIPRRLMRDDGCEITISTTILYEHDATRGVGLIRVRTDRHLQQLDVAPGAVRADAGAQLQLRTDRYGLIDRLRIIGYVAGRLTIKGHLVFEPARRLLHHPRHPGAVRTETINPLKQTRVVASARCVLSCCYISYHYSKLLSQISLIYIYKN